MEFAPDGPKAIPLWINGRAFLTAAESFYVTQHAETGEPLWRVPLAGAMETGEAVAAARGAQDTWAAMGVAARRVCLATLAKSLDCYTGHFARMLVQECGCSQEEAIAEVEFAVAALKGERLGESGVLGVVVDNTRPLAAFAEALAPALMAGATLVVKPSVKAPSAVFALCELSSRSDWPAGVLNVVHGDVAALEGLCAAGIDRLVYVGQAELGEQVQRIADANGTVFEMKPA